MSAAAVPDLSDPCEPVRGRLGRTIDFNRRHAGITGLGLWVAGAGVFAVHSSGIALPDATRFAMLDAWLIGLGSLGCPFLALRTLGRWLRPETCIGIAIFCFALAFLLTALTVSGALHFNTLDGLFAVLLPEAAAIQALNAADVQIHGRQREGRAYRDGRGDEAGAQIDLYYRALAGLKTLEEMKPPELAALIEVAQGVLDAAQTGQPPLRLVSTPRRPAAAPRRVVRTGADRP